MEVVALPPSLSDLAPGNSSRSLLAWLAERKTRHFARPVDKLGTYSNFQVSEASGSIAQLVRACGC